MTELGWRLHERWQVGLLLDAQPKLSIVPTTSTTLRFVGGLSFTATNEEHVEISDEFDIAMDVPKRFPKALPTVRESGGRIPSNFHTNPDGTLCLGSATRLLLAISEQATLLGFVELCVVPYFYGFCHWRETGEMPFGELRHGTDGVVRDYMGLFGVKTVTAVRQMLELASLPKGVANKKQCPCGSGQVVGKCHNRMLNQLRCALGRSHFREQLEMLFP